MICGSSEHGKSGISAGAKTGSCPGPRTKVKTMLRDTFSEKKVFNRHPNFLEQSIIGKMSEPPEIHRDVCVQYCSNTVQLFRIKLAIKIHISSIGGCWHIEGAKKSTYKELYA